MHIAFIGFGEAARAFTDTLAAHTTPPSFSAWDIRMDEEMRSAMAARSVRAGDGPGTAIEDAEWIVGAVTADQSLEAARSVLPHLAPGQLYIDINSVSPDRKREAAAAVEAAGGRYLDMAVMAPVHPRGHATPVLLAGPEAEALSGAFTELGFAFEVAGPSAGDATAVKMVRSLFVKGLEAITVETLLAASASGCFDRVLASLEASYPGLKWPEQASYNFERSLRHGTRRAAEMHESAKTLDALGLCGGLAARVAEVQARMGEVALDELPGGDFGTAVDAILRQRTTGAESG